MNTPELMVKHLTVYQNNSKGTYRGINRVYFPKWKGWLLLETNRSLKELEQAVEEFYLVQFYYQMKLDQFNNQAIAFLLFNFATLEGKKKALSKLKQVANSIEDFNSMGVEVEYRLILEVLEFYNYISNSNTEWVYQIYRTL